MAGIDEFTGLFLPIEGELIAYILAMGVRSSDADDVLQDAAKVMLEKIGQYARGTNFRAWAFAIVRNKIHEHFRREERRRLNLSENARETIEGLLLEEESAPNVMLKALSVCLERLQPKARRIVRMRYWDQRSVPEIGRALRRSVDYVYMILSRIRKSLHECIGRYRMSGTANGRE
ncbi:MAG: sigma-70 family RNA polymerase sigma factor [Kiritimatiellae bacterium]|nr:sigma-70 family RNA polymerase sigma factor [Kiritimatiellia bacterium]